MTEENHKRKYLQIFHSETLSIFTWSPIPLQLTHSPVGNDFLWMRHFEESKQVEVITDE